MQIDVIKDLVEGFTTEELDLAEDALLNDTEPDIKIPGDDAGEQLTHVLAAIWVIYDMYHFDKDFRSSIRSYYQKVRKSID
mgnify:CR=1 FL=1